ncbi:TPA: polysaccharide biosynthesis C-terminal domain-containing protein, partial [Streptococcus suis]
SSDYFTAWYLVPLLTLGTIFSAFSDYFATNYIVSKKTEGILRTSMYGGLVNFLLNIVLITFLGLVGAALSNAISFFVIFLLRYYGTKDIVDVKIDWTQIYGSILLIILQLILLFFDLEIMLLIQFLLLICIVYLNKFFICTLINKIVR